MTVVVAVTMTMRVVIAVMSRGRRLVVVGRANGVRVIGHGVNSFKSSLESQTRYSNGKRKIHTTSTKCQ